MSEKPQTGPNIREFAKVIEEALNDIEFIGNNGMPYNRNYEEDARWYTAYQMAEDMRETYTVKDWAYYTQDGMQPLTDEDVREWFQDEDEETGDPIGEPKWPDKQTLVRFFHG